MDCFDEGFERKQSVTIIICCFAKYGISRRPDSSTIVMRNRLFCSEQRSITFGPHSLINHFQADGFAVLTAPVLLKKQIGVFDNVRSSSKYVALFTKVFIGYACHLFSA